MSEPVGWIPAYRRMFEPGHWLAPTGHDPASRLHAWLDLCQMATHRPRKVRHMSLERGQVIVSLRTLARRWRWHMSTVRRFISELKVSTALSTVSETPEGTIYRVVNYDTYAIGEKPDETLSETQVSTGAKQEQEGKKSRRTSKTIGQSWKFVPDSWTPTEQHIALAKELGRDMAAVELEFRDHEYDKPKTDANKCFNTFLRNAAKWGQHPLTNGKKPFNPRSHLAQPEDFLPGGMFYRPEKSNA